MAAPTLENVPFPGRWRTSSHRFSRRARVIPTERAGRHILAAATMQTTARTVHGGRVARAAAAPAEPPHAASQSTIDWPALEPRSFYARLGRPCFLSLILLLGLPLAIAAAALIAPFNLVVFGSFSGVFFLQQRIGYRGRVFSIWKFRTMREARRSSHDSWGSGEDGLRVTRFGRFLRSSHLDELPQLVNVLKGDMSLIGPRPEMIEVEVWAAEHVPGFTERLAIRPGLTGLAQITQGYTGNDATAYGEKLVINREYLRSMSFALDVSIVMRTAVWMLSGRGWSNYRLNRLAPASARS